MKKIKLIGSLTLLILFLVIIMQNTEVVDTNILFVTVSMPRAALLGITMLIGIIVGVGLAFFMGKDSSKNE